MSAKDSDKEKLFVQKFTIVFKSTFKKKLKFFIHFPY